MLYGGKGAEPPYKTYILKKIVPLPYKKAYLFLSFPLREGAGGWARVKFR